MLLKAPLPSERAANPEARLVVGGGRASETHKQAAAVTEAHERNAAGLRPQLVNETIDQFATLSQCEAK